MQVKSTRRTVHAVLGAVICVAGGIYDVSGGKPAAAVTAPVVAASAPAAVVPTIGVVESDGALFSTAGNDQRFRSLAAPVTAWAPNPGGAWEVATDGGVFARHAPYYGSLGGIRLAQPIVGMAATPDGRGYWLVASDGGIFAFGHAVFHGSLGRVHLTRPIVAMAATPDGRGYWLVASDGGIFAFGDAGFYGSLARVHLAQPIVAMTVNRSATGYWLMSGAGAVFAFGRAGFYGSVPSGSHVSAVSITGNSLGGYDTMTVDGKVWQFAYGRRPSVVSRQNIPAAYVAAANEQAAAAEAVTFALAQVGKPYVAGGSGPNVFDCSGLTSFAYGSAGIRLPRTAAQQFAALRHVSLAQARPGDLLFFYPGITHVGIYLGDGLMVDAPHSGASVRVEAFSPWFGPVMGVSRPA